MQFTRPQEDLRRVLRQSIGETLVGSTPRWWGLTTVLVDFVAEMLSAPGFRIVYVGRNKCDGRDFVDAVRDRLRDMVPGIEFRRLTREHIAVTNGSTLKIGINRGTSVSVLIADGPVSGEAIHWIASIARVIGTTIIFNCKEFEEMATKTYKITLGS